MIGDGGDKNQVAKASNGAFIQQYRIEEPETSHKDKNGFFILKLESEKLADLRGNDYLALEPQPRVSPDNKWVFFHSNMFGAPSIFAVEVNKNISKTIPKKSTSQLSQQRKARYKSILMIK